MVKQTAGRDQLGEFAPKFAELNDDVLFGEVWSREGQLPLKTRSIVTITALISKGITDSSLKYHLMTAKKNGVSKSEMAEILTHLAFYAGWPNAWAAFNMAKEVYGDDESSGHGGFFGMGEPNDGFAQYFTGNSYLNPVTKEDDPLQIHNVTFEPGCINHWHIHHASKGGGQVLIGVEGEGWCQIEGQDPIKILPGTIVEVPAGAKHWHGASKNSWFSHLAFMIPGEDLSNEWLEQVDEDFYNTLD
ncbi:Gamma-carboxymuconolactone decarboxylase [Lactobacillus delbrueckii subsp. delbrueckii]|uniref:Gamma-carboxymuconolactone decarboxylase n=1 Tax=Lactobacillus delbrueckii subsp. delbrueckii TaxID=83684 RepID=A0AAU9R590_9LACO|nr:carboxymuconolactone decarboxylase family protein [Lactobacillus delbrueckii]MCT4391101.1 gamma-carboxymuconolactone decarboxylase [Lactobacillus delbrueckii]CAH1706088.1 Gamma-carboxymuconolactone decarboxylase [Lactobacillus delbrueckii subsp. delbrueckii]